MKAAKAKRQEKVTKCGKSMVKKAKKGSGSHTGTSATLTAAAHTGKINYLSFSNLKP
jgi:hypothetical protein